ncbi:hypothetical protein LTR84_004587 [Exophiala bonariae]|uniref:Uncharacterized protein n=1 Tax=Exophiala bonariae TaxID=1690606 RepID=A0AAV9NMK3_9EURO|nr:hypothetical protein LTR84_004587 [Exophiala bonariae]
MSRAIAYGTLNAVQNEIVVISSSHESHQSDRESGERTPLGTRRRRVRRTNDCCCARCCCVLGSILIVGLVCFGLFYLWLVSTVSCYSNFHPPRQVRRYSDFKNQSFTVGFDLSAGYGTASVSFFNGTVVDVARVDSTERYNEVLNILSDPSSAHPSPPYYNCAHSFNDISRQWARYLRKKKGQPASPEVAALIDVLGPLKEQVDIFLVPYGTLEMAFITVPDFPAIYTEDLHDAAEHVKFQLLTLPNYRSGDQAQWPVNELNAAVTGNGIGLSSSIGGRSDPRHDNEASFRYDNDNTFLVLYTQTVLTAFTGPFGVSHGLSSHYYAAAGIRNFSMGLSQCSQGPGLQSYECPKDSPYWEELRQNLRAGLGSYWPRGRDLARVISWGESAHNEVFTAVLEQEVIAAQSDPENRPQFYSDSPVFSPARGAAEFGKICAYSTISFACIPDIHARMQGW